MTPRDGTQQEVIDAPATGGVATSSPETRARRIVLRSGWQIENIGDVAHTFGALALLERHMPDAHVTFWPWYKVLPDYEIRMLDERFPNVDIVQGTLDENGRGSTPELDEAVASADFMLHNSGPFALAWRDMQAFTARTGKPFGIYGVTYGHWVWGTEERKALDDAAFVYFRDSPSLVKALEDGVAAPIMEWSPDVAFAIDVTDDEAADELLAAHGLREGEFLCCLPKQRYTPSWEHVLKEKPFDDRFHRRNEEMKEHDHIPLRQAIIEVVRRTGLKVLIANEDETETEIGKTWVLDHLPDDVKEKVVWLDRPWELGQALGVYKKSAGLFSNEMHSPIMCIAFGVPAILNRWVEQSSKGVMWEDIGLDEWLFNFDYEGDVARFPDAVLHLALNLDEAKEKAAAARERVHARFAETIAVLDATVEAAR